MRNSSLLVNVSKLTHCDHESIIQSLITNVDEVWINALAFEINDSEVERQLRALNEAGLVRVWDYEKSMSNHSTNMVAKVLTVEEYKAHAEYVEVMMEELVKARMTQSSDYTTFNIEMRNMLTNLLTAKFCNAESIIQRDSRRVDISTGKQDVFQRYTDCLFNYTNIDSVSALSIESILELRKYSRFFRDRIQKMINDHILTSDIPLSQIREDCRKLSMEYCNELNARIRGGISPSGTAKGVALDIASIWLAPVTILSITQKLWDSVFNRKQRGYIMYLTTLTNNIRGARSE